MGNITRNDSILGQTTPYQPTVFVKGILSDAEFSLFMEYSAYITICVAVPGLVGNVLILITYAKIGFSESINISYFALGVSDILCVIFVTWHGICFIPAFENSDIPFNPLSIPTGGHTSSMFQKTTGWITAYVSIERCLCVVFPLKSQIIASRKRTIIVIVFILVLIVVPSATVAFYTYQIYFKFDASSNKTVLVVTFRNSSLAKPMTNILRIYKLVFLNSLPFFIIIVCTVVLAIYLHRSALWRLDKSSGATKTIERSVTNDEKALKKYARDIRVAKSVLAIAIAFIFPGTLGIVRYLIALIWSDFHPVGTYSNISRSVARLEFILSSINSSVNFIIYYRMGKKFRSTVNQMIFQKCKRSPVHKKVEQTFNRNPLCPP